jgi:hypothetical protein
MRRATTDRGSYVNAIELLQLHMLTAKPVLKATLPTLVPRDRPGHGQTATLVLANPVTQSPSHTSTPPHPPHQDLRQAKPPAPTKAQLSTACTDAEKAPVLQENTNCNAPVASLTQDEQANALTRQLPTDPETPSPPSTSKIQPRTFTTVRGRTPLQSCYRTSSSCCQADQLHHVQGVHISCITAPLPQPPCLPCGMHVA